MCLVAHKSFNCLNMMMFQLEMPAILMMLGIFFGAVALPIVLYLWREKNRRQKAEKDLDDWVRSNPYQLQSLTEQIKEYTASGGYPRIRIFKDLSDRISSSGVMGIDLNYLDDAHPLKEQVAQLQAYPEHYKTLRKQLKSKYIERELKHANDFFNTIEKSPLTDMQRRAVIVHEENNLIIAGATKYVKNGDRSYTAHIPWRKKK